VASSAHSHSRIDAGWITARASTPFLLPRPSWVSFQRDTKINGAGWPRRLLGNILISFQKNFTGKMSVIRSGTHCPVRHRNGSIHSSGSFEKSLIGENNYVNRFNIARPIG
jgi:hypothetical protein